MTERGLSNDGAPACPFVAFEDDRDGRSTAPDHRHRCFAEPRPAPRALAHQEAYCLSSAFPVCPTFQDWARREAAAARPAATAASTPRDEPAQGRSLPPADLQPRQAPGATPPPAIPSRRPPQRDWAAPPPWAGEDAGSVSGAAAAAGAAGLAAAGAAWDAPSGDDAPRAPAPATRSPVPDGASRGLADSAAYRLAGPDPAEPEPARPAYDDLDDAWAAGGAGAGAYVAGSATARPSAGTSRDLPPPRRSTPPPRPAGSTSPGGTSGSGSGGRPPQVSAPVQQDASELFGPAWEQPRRYEAYPTLRTRMGLPGLGGLPRVAIWALILLLAALVVFLFGPSLLGIGGDGGSGAASPTPAPTEEVSAEPEPTVPPVPTPQVHVVVKGETMSKIAKKYGLTVEELLAANPQIKNPNKIKIGDEITIPVPVQDDTLGGDGGTVEGASQAP
jgi:LysM domain